MRVIGQLILETIILTCANGLWTHCGLAGRTPKFWGSESEDRWCLVPDICEKLGMLVDKQERIWFIIVSTSGKSYKDRNMLSKISIR